MRGFVIPRACRFWMNHWRKQPPSSARAAYGPRLFSRERAGEGLGQPTAFECFSLGERALYSREARRIAPRRFLASATSARNDKKSLLPTCHPERSEGSTRSDFPFRGIRKAFFGKERCRSRVAIFCLRLSLTRERRRARVKRASGEGACAGTAGKSFANSGRTFRSGNLMPLSIAAAGCAASPEPSCAS